MQLHELKPCVLNKPTCHNYSDLLIFQPTRFCKFMGTKVQQHIQVHKTYNSDNNSNNKESK